MESLLPPLLEFTFSTWRRRRDNLEVMFTCAKTLLILDLLCKTAKVHYKPQYLNWTQEIKSQCTCKLLPAPKDRIVGLNPPVFLLNCLASFYMKSTRKSNLWHPLFIGLIAPITHSMKMTVPVSVKSETGRRALGHVAINIVILVSVLLIQYM